MGLGLGFSSSENDKSRCGGTTIVNNVTVNLPNPDPGNWEVKQSEQIGDWLVVKVRYPDCTNYEGNKILVYKDATVWDLMKQCRIDPHFSDSEEWLTPFARFEPTEKGWQKAVEFTKMQT